MPVSVSEAVAGVREERVVDLLIDLCRTDSAPLKEKELFRRVRAELVDLGFEAEEDDTAPVTGSEVGNLFAVKPGRGGMASEPPVMFSAHLDRVAGGIGVKPVLREGEVRSDGSTVLGADDAAGIAAILEACRVMEENDLPHPPIEVVFTVGEEVGLVGAKAFDVSRLKSPYGYVLDASGPVGAIVRRAPTQYSITARVLGRSAHAGVAPEKGVSAVKIAAAAIARMRLGRIDPETTANVGSISGGGPTNIVPDRVEFHAETRSLDRRKVERQLESMRRAVMDAAERHGGRAEWEAKLSFESFALDDGAPVVRRAVNAVRRLGFTEELRSTGGGSDANVFNAKGIPCAVLCVGYQGIHTFDESMPVRELVNLAKLVLAILAEKG